MRNSIKKISLYILIASFTWLPIQATFAAVFIPPANMSMHSVSKSPAMHLSLATQESQQLSNALPCHTTGQKKNCCNQADGCSQMGPDCNHCASFIAIAQGVQQPIIKQHYFIQHSYNNRLTGVTSLSAYRPPC